MGLGYIYILGNRFYSPNVLKIGFTTKKPDERAKQIYHGATGVPIKFDILFACSSVNCKTDEKKIHNLLNGYRLNKRREFFCVPPRIARSIILNTIRSCPSKNGLLTTEVVVDKIGREDSYSAKNNALEMKNSKNLVFMSVSLKNVKKPPIGRSKITADQVRRIIILKELIGDVYPIEIEEWITGFSRDANPEREISIWECMARTYMNAQTLDFFSDKLRKEIFQLILFRTSLSTSHILKYKEYSLSTYQVRKILGEYSLRPMPVRYVYF